MTKKTRELLNNLTIHEKVSLLFGDSTWTTSKIERFNISSLLVSDGPCGLVAYEDNKKIKSMSYPSPSALASTFDLDLVEKVAYSIGTEAKEFGTNMILAPGVNIKRTPLCGRNFEYFSEDSLLNGLMGSKFIEGLHRAKVFATLKHFALNNQENYRTTASSNIDEYSAMELYLKPFFYALRKKPEGLMLSYNKVNGIYATENKKLIDIAKKNFDFKGLFISDWNATSSSIKSFQAGLNLEMPGKCLETRIDILNKIEANKIKEKLIDKRITKLLTLAEKCDFKKRKANYKFIDRISFEASLSSMVLLKNESNILPLNLSNSINIFGINAEHPVIQGYGSSKVNPRYSDNFIEILEKNKIKFKYIPALNEDYTINSTFDNIKDLASNGDISIVFVSSIIETEAVDRKDKNLPQNMTLLIDEVTKYSNKVIVVLEIGSSILIPWIDKVRGVILKHFSGSFGSSALFSLITGKNDFQGRLAESYSKNNFESYLKDSQNDIFTNNYSENIFSGYRYYTNHKEELLFPFGYGLKYNEIKYLGFKVVSRNENDFPLEITISVSNTTNLKISDIIQIYLEDENNYKRLIYFSKITLDTLEVKDIKILIPYLNLIEYSLSYANYIVKSGKYTISLGKNSIYSYFSEPIELKSYIFQNNKVNFPTLRKTKEKVDQDFPISKLNELDNIRAKRIYIKLYDFIHSIDDTIKELFYEYAINLPIRAIGTYLDNNNITKYLVAYINNDKKTVAIYKNLVPEFLK
ncbi:MAG: glycoside hydrolase family 3 C-terminal domain-containing protein [Acholeplasmatales bacterium]|jgi:beta-glucosidase|nr:glycoside hydrolase family 3 C-terminal domain-containing protein [Acholeplasmatales bacterium]